MALSGGSGYELVELRDGLHTLRDRATGETFHPAVGPLAEALAIHIAPLELEKKWRAGKTFTVWDVGFGAAANAVALLEKLQTLPTAGHCELISFDHTLAPLEFALEHAEKLAYPVPWRESLHALIREKKVDLSLPGGSTVAWRLCLADFTEMPAAPAPDGVIYDPYSPRKNPAMWSLEHFSRLHTRLSRPAVLTSYSRSTAVRVTLLLAGFHVGIGHATGEKDQTTVAATHLDLLQRPLDEKWLDRVRQSTSSRPLGSHETGPIGAADLARLERHPQFSATPAAAHR